MLFIRSSIFGQQPAFGGFGLSTPTQTSPFGNTFQKIQLAFGSKLLDSSTPFDASSQPTFGATCSPVFGPASTPTFGSTTTPTFGRSGITFGESSGPVFGSR